MPRKPNPEGDCPLCLARGVVLQKSHLIPAGVYKRLKSNDGRHPSLIRNAKLVECSRQTWAHLLCALCENRLSTRGERWVLSNGVQKDAVTFPLLTHLMGSKATSTDRTMGVSQPPISEHYDAISIRLLCCFGVLERGSPQRGVSRTCTPLRLGPYAERLRRFLLD